MWVFGKHSFKICRKILPIFDFTFSERGGLNHVIFLALFFLFFGKNSGKVETYTGCTVGFKVRHDTHMRQAEDDSNGSTTLSSHIKSLKESNTPHTITWSAKERAPPFNPSTGWCRLCTLERYYILFEPGEASLNQRAEFFCHCFHKRPQLLINRK